MKRNASTIPRRKKLNERESIRYSIRMIHDGKSTHLLRVMPGRKSKMGDYDVNYQPSDVDNSTPLHFTPPSWSCMEAAASAVAENRSDPMWLWLVVVNFIVSTAHSRATEPVIGRVPPLDGICLAETSHDGCWSCYKVRGHSARKERTEKPTNEPRDDIFSQRDMLLGCCCYCRRSWVLVDHRTCHCPKIFRLLLLLLRPPKLHD